MLFEQQILFQFCQLVNPIQSLETGILVAQQPFKALIEASRFELRHMWRQIQVSTCLFIQISIMR